MAIALIALAATETTQANFAWITNTNGVVWKQDIPRSFLRLQFADSDKPKIAQIVVPENTDISTISAYNCVNLTNIVIQPKTSITVWIENTKLQNITIRPGMEWKVLLRLNHIEHAFPLALFQIKRTFVELPKLEIRTHTTTNGKEVEVIWRTGNLQIADAVSGEWKDYNGSSPLRFSLTNPFAHPKDKQFFRIKPEEEESQ